MDRCLLCGSVLSDNDHSDEHVFPKWLLDRHGLWDQRISLLNKTEIPYRKLRVPCCQRCNNEHLSRIENSVRVGFSGGISALEHLDPKTFQLWLVKIFYGMLFRELSLPFTREDESNGAIVPAEMMRSVSSLHLLLQAARGLASWPPSVNPCSVLLFECQVSPHGSGGANFDYRDGFSPPFLAIRSREIGIVTAIGDWGDLSSEVSSIPQVKQARNIVLHPWQFTEVCAAVAYALRRYRSGRTMMPVHGEDHVEILPLEVGESVLEDYQEEQFAELLAEFWAVPIGDLYFEGTLFTSLLGADGRPLRLP